MSYPKAKRIAHDCLNMCKNSARDQTIGCNRNFFLWAFSPFVSQMNLYAACCHARCFAVNGKKMICLFKWTAHFICSLENNRVGKFLSKPKRLCLLFKQCCGCCQIQNFAKGQKIGLFRQFICCLQNFGCGKTVWKVNKEFLASIESCLHRYFLESR